METIRNYIESMFRTLPQTEKVLRAKSELYQMMEDKYTELIKEGKSENEAVGTVISEFGNLEDLSSTLGIADIFKTTREENINRRKLTFDEVKGFLEAKRSAALFVAAGVFFCINCVIGPIITDALHMNDILGVCALFVLIAVGISCFIISNSRLDEYKYIYKESCSIDSAEREFLMNKRRENTNTYSMQLTIGIVLCVLCVVPPIAFDGLGVLEELSAAMLFIVVGAGVFLICYANIIRGSYDQLLGVNNKAPSDIKDEDAIYTNKYVKVIMSVYWQTITCIYLCISFATGDWHITWIIWPIAGVLVKILRAIFEDTGAEN